MLKCALCLMLAVAVVAGTFFIPTAAIDACEGVAQASEFSRHRERGRYRTRDTRFGTFHRERGRYRSRSFEAHAACDADTSACGH